MVYFGTWRIWPRLDAERVLVYSEHVCNGRMARARVMMPLSVAASKSEISRKCFGELMGTVMKK